MSSKDDIAIWDFYKDEHIVREINSVQLNLDIGNIVDDICELIQIHVGDLTTCKDVLKGLKLNIKNLYYSEEDKKEIFSKVKDKDGKDMNLMISFYKEIKEESFECRLFCREAYKIYRLNIDILMTQAGNMQATRKVNQVVNRQVSGFFAQMCPSPNNSKAI
jgi:hypothetical protein